MALKFTTPFRPVERKDYTCDWTAEMVDTDDTIASTTFVLGQDATTAGLEIYLTQVSQDGMKAALWLRSNDPEQTRALLGQTISIVHGITTTLGRQLTQTLQIKVSEG